jgi:thioredoxin reductase (NADPH)
MEAKMCHGDPVAVVGGGNSAGQAALFLSEHTPAVHLVVREGELTEHMSRYLTDRIERSRNIEVMLHTEVRELVGGRTLEGLVAEDNRTGERRTVDARALFVFIGAAPHTGWLGGQVALDDSGFILTGPAAAHAPGNEAWSDVTRQPLLLETSLPGLLAAGDVRRGSIKRVASAVGEGSMSVQLVHEALAGRHGRLTHAPGAGQ